MGKWLKWRRSIDPHEELARLDSDLIDIQTGYYLYLELVRRKSERYEEIPSTWAERIIDCQHRAQRLLEQRTKLAFEIADGGASPRIGERILLLILTKEERVNIPGDLEEEYRGIAAKHGARYAKLWYYKQVAASAWPMMRKALGWGLLASVGTWIRRLI